MRKLSILLLIFMVCLLFACSEGGAVSAPAPVPPQEPATPLPPERESSERPATAMPADTPEPAATATFSAPVAVLPTYIPEPSATNTSIPMATAAPLAPALAVLPAYTPEPSPTKPPVPTSTPFTSEDAAAQRDENVARCQHWAMQNFEPIEFARFERLDPKIMTDLDRILWSKMIASPRARFNLFNIRSNETEWCQDYWSEPLTEHNAHKRNEQFRDECRNNMVRRAKSYERTIKNRAEYAKENAGIDVPPVIVNQHMRMMNWTDIEGMELLQMQERPFALVKRIYEGREEGHFEEWAIEEGHFRINHFPSTDTPSEILEWWGIEGAFFSHSDSSGNNHECGLYYPQLFYDRWIPIEAYGMQDEIASHAKGIQEAKESGAWPEWADQKNRDVLIRLEN